MDFRAGELEADWNKLEKVPWIVIKDDFFNFKKDVFKEMLLKGSLSAEHVLYGNVRAVDFAFAAICSDLILQKELIYLEAFELLLFNSRTITDTTSFQWIVDKLPEEIRPDALQIIYSTLDERNDRLESFFCYYHTFLSRTFVAPELVSLIHIYARLNESNPPPLIT